MNPILTDREARWLRRVSLAQAYCLPVGTLTLNIPGPNKTPLGSRETFTRLVWQWREILRAADILIIHSESRIGADGPCHHLVVRGQAEDFKSCSILLEERGPLGRLADADILDSTGRPLSRADMHLPPRQCLLCSQEAALCIRQGKHKPQDVLYKVQDLLRAGASLGPLE